VKVSYMTRYFEDLDTNNLDFEEVVGNVEVEIEFVLVEIGIFE